MNVEAVSIALPLHREKEKREPPIPESEKALFDMVSLTKERTLEPWQY